MIEYVRELLRDAVEEPGRAISRLVFLWWIWSTVRGALTRKKPEPELPSSEAQPAPAPAPVPRKPPPPAPTPKPVAQAKPPRRSAAAPARPSAKKPDPTQPPWAEALQRAQQLRLRLGADRRLRWLEQILADEVIEPLQVAQARSSLAEPAPDIERRGRGALLTLQVLERVQQERAAEPEGTRLAEIDTIAASCLAPLLDYATAESIAMRGRTPLAVRFQVDAPLYARGLTKELLLVPVPHGVGGQLQDYVSVLHEVGRRWYFALPQLERALQDALDLAERMHLPNARRGYDEHSVQACFGPWLSALVADLVLSLRLGSGYVAGLRKLVEQSGDRATFAYAEGAYLSPVPPPLLRLRVALAALDALGQSAEADRHRAALQAVLPDTTRSYLPVDDGRYLVIGTSYLLSLTDEIVSVCLQVRDSELGGAPLIEWPGLVQAAADEQAQRRLSQGIASGPAGLRAEPAQLLAAALLAWDAGHEPARLLAQLQRALQPTSAEPAAIHHAPRAQRTSSPRNLAAAFHDPATLRRAIVLGAALGRRRALAHNGGSP